MGGGVEIVRDQEVRFGKPVIRGTRVSVVDILRALRSGWTIDEVAEEFRIPREAVIEAIRYAEEKLGESACAEPRPSS